MSKSLEIKGEIIPVINITLPIKGNEAVGNCTADWHIGTRGLDQETIVSELDNEARKYKGNIIRFICGDLSENSLKTSVGHNYDITIPDPEEQKDAVIKLLNKTNKVLYTREEYKNIKEDIDKQIYVNVKSLMCEGNHEYRSRKATGQWLGKEMCKDTNTAWIGEQAIINLKIVNKKSKKEKIYKIYMTHAIAGKTATSEETIRRSFRKKMVMMPGIDIMICGHYHKEVKDYAVYYDIESKQLKKVLFIVCPSPMGYTEYARIGGYSPYESNVFTNFYMPIDKNKQPYAFI